MSVSIVVDGVTWELGAYADVNMHPETEEAFTEAARMLGELPGEGELKLDYTGTTVWVTRAFDQFKVTIFGTHLPKPPEVVKEEPQVVTHVRDLLEEVMPGRRPAVVEEVIPDRPIQPPFVPAPTPPDPIIDPGSEPLEPAEEVQP